MSRQEVNLPLKSSVRSAAKDFLHIFKLDILINRQKILLGIILGAAALLFGFLLWIFFIYILSNFLLVQGLTKDATFTIIILLNIGAFIACVMVSLQQFKKIRFSYTSEAVKKITHILGD